MKCVECGGRLKEGHGSVTVLVHGEEIVVDGIDHLVCTLCGEEAFRIDSAGEMRRKANEQYKRTHGLLTGSEIGVIREGLGVNQKEQ